MGDGAAGVGRLEAGERRSGLPGSGYNADMEAERLRELISSDPEIMHGQVCIRGTRIPVSVVLDCIGGGMSDAEILAEYPTLTADAIHAAAAYGAMLAREEIIPLPSGS